MPPSPPPNRKSSSTNQSRLVLSERRPLVRTCEPCRRRRRQCNGQRPCSHCSESCIDCVYSVVSDLSRSVFSTSNARRLSSGSACETCRRRKTKCDGGNPCAFCASAGVECVNNSERRKRSMGVPTSNFSASPADADAIDRIEDRLRRIEKLMSAFQPATNSPLAMTSTDATGAFHKLSSPPKMVRQHRHSVQGISVAKEQAELRTAHALKKKRDRRIPGMSPPPALFRETSTSAAARYATPPNSGGAKDYDFCTSSPSPPPPPLSPTAMMRQNSGQAQPLTSSMLNLSLSPSSSSTSSTSNSSMLQPLAPQSSLSTPPAGLVPSTTTPTGQQTSNGWPIKTESHNGQMVAQQPSPPSSSRSHHWSEEWKTTSMPSLMDQLSKRTFAASSAYNISTTNGGFPPYPLTPPHSYPRQQPSSPSPARPTTDQVNSE